MVVILTSGIFLTGCTSGQDSQNATSLVGEAQTLFVNREYKKAVDKYNEALNLDPQNEDGYLGLVTLLLEKGYLAKAEEVAKEADNRVSDKKVAEIYTLIANKYSVVGDYSNAIRLYEVVLGKDKSSNDVRVSEGEAALKQGKISDANKYLGGVPNNSDDARYLLVKAYIAANNWKDADGFLSNINESTYKGDTKDKVAGLKKVYALSDSDQMYKVTMLAREYIQSGYPYLAIDLLEKQGDTFAEYWDGQYFLGRAYYDFKNYDKAIEKLNNAVSLGVDDAGMYALLAKAYVVKGDVEKGLSLYEKAISFIDIKTQDYIVKDYLGVLMSNNLYNKAKNLLTSLVKNNDYPWVRLLLCDIYYSQDDSAKMKEQMDSLDKFTNLSSGEQKQLARYRVLYALKNSKDSEAISALITTYEGFDKYNPEVYLFKGKLDIFMSKNDEAKTMLEKALELDTTGEFNDEVMKILATVK